MVGRHFGYDLGTGDVSAVDQLGQQGIDQGFLPRVGMGFVMLTLGAEERAEETLFPKSVIDRQAGLPRLGSALSGVKNFGFGREAVEVVPFGLEQPDSRAVLALQLDPVDIVETVGEQIVEVAVELPVLQLRAV